MLLNVLFLFCSAFSYAFLHAFVVVVLSDELRQNQGRRLVDRKLVKALSKLIAGRPKALFCFGSFVIYDFSRYI